jgi:putative transposase
MDRPASPQPDHGPRRAAAPGQVLIRDRGSNFTAAFDAVLAGAGIRIVLCNVQAPRMNAIIERWIGGCRRELLDRTLIWNQTHLQRILPAYEIHTISTGRTPPLDAAAPLNPCPYRSISTGTASEGRPTPVA